MRWTKAWFAAAVTASALACFKTAAQKAAEVRECSRITMNAQGAAQCLVLQHNWKEPAALAAATKYQQEQDSIAQLHADSTWRAEAARHKKEMAECAKDPRAMWRAAWSGTAGRTPGRPPRKIRCGAIAGRSIASRSRPAPGSARCRRVRVSSCTTSGAPRGRSRWMTRSVGADEEVVGHLVLIAAELQGLLEPAQLVGLDVTWLSTDQPTPAGDYVALVPLLSRWVGGTELKRLPI